MRSVARLFLLATACASALRPGRIPNLDAPLTRRAIAGAAAAVALPLPALADRGKDLYQSDIDILSGRSGALNENVALPEYDEEGKLINANGYEEETSTRA